MKNNLPFDFIVNKKENTVKVVREFAASQDLVWATWTEPELLDQWWGSKPWFAKTKSMEFKVGGRRLYAMCGPNGKEHWAFCDYLSITPKTNFKHRNGFCDSEGNDLDADPPHSDWSIDFTAAGDSTTVSVFIQHESLAALEMMIEMGFKEGFSMALDGLDELLLTL